MRNNRTSPYLWGFTLLTVVPAVLFGDTVSFVDIFTEGMNDAGQIAFFFELDSGRRGIARADPQIVQPPSAAVSAASTLPLLSIGLCALACAARRKIPV